MTWNNLTLWVLETIIKVELSMTRTGSRKLVILATYRASAAWTSKKGCRYRTENHKTPILLFSINVSDFLVSYTPKNQLTESLFKILFFQVFQTYLFLWSILLNVACISVARRFHDSSRLDIHPQVKDWMALLGAHMWTSKDCKKMVQYWGPRLLLDHLFL